MLPLSSLMLLMIVGLSTCSFCKKFRISLSTCRFVYPLLIKICFDRRISSSISSRFVQRFYALIKNPFTTSVLYRSGHSLFALRHLPLSVGLRYTVVLYVSLCFSTSTFRNGSLFSTDFSIVKFIPEISDNSSFSSKSTFSSQTTKISSI